MEGIERSDPEGCLSRCAVGTCMLAAVLFLDFLDLLSKTYEDVFLE